MVNTENFNAEGFLLHTNAWSKELAVSIAAKEGIQIIEQHWAIIEILRQFYFDCQNTPPLRHLVKQMVVLYGPELGNSSYLHQILKGQPLLIGSKIAGLPKPKRCM